MTQVGDIEIRRARKSDIDALVTFFIKAYGGKTIFQSKKFLLYYFGSWIDGAETFGNSLIGIKKDGEIVAHYGGLYYELSYNNVKYPLIWGVNAYTLPEWRGKSINSEIINILINDNKINGVIGFTKDISLFYSTLGYNIFEFNRFSRFIYSIQCEKTLEIVQMINSNRNFLPRGNNPTKYSSSTFVNIVELTKENIHSLKLELDEDFQGIATSKRSQKFIEWRFLNNSFINYKIYGYIQEKKLMAYIVFRIETIKSEDALILRIIDLFGKTDKVEKLIQFIIYHARSSNYTYIDISLFGNIYDKILINSGFVKLDGEDYGLFPQVFDPIESRMNNEYIGLQSSLGNIMLSKLSIENVYFTRMDSDRDRIGRIPNK